MNAVIQNKTGQQANFGSVFSTFDPYFQNVSLLLHFDGVNGSSATVDSSVNNFPISMSNMTITTTNTTPKFGVGCLSGSTAFTRLVAVSSSRFHSNANEDLTVEFYLKSPIGAAKTPVLFTTQPGFAGVSKGHTVVVSNGSGAGTIEWIIVDNNGNTGLDIITTASVLTVNAGGAWQHVACVRSGSIGNNCIVYVNGSPVISGNYTGSIGSSSPFTIGVPINDTTDSHPVITGFMDEFRWTRGVARYSGSFTTSSLPFPSNGNIILNSTITSPQV